jgi:Cu-Zn family superoxide dismutase
MRTLAFLTLPALSLAVAACDRHEPAVGSPLAGGAHATATLRTATGADAGRATVTDVAGGMRVTLDARGLQPGTHGAHLHTVGRCDAPDFASAGPHWNPDGRQHGAMNPRGPHAGDMPNLIVGTDGRGTVGVTLPGATVAGLLDADGGALVVHANPDDLMTDPSGNSGGRIACGVFTPA